VYSGGAVLRGRGLPPVRGLPPFAWAYGIKEFVDWFYVKNCIFVHITDEIFLVTDPFGTPGIPTACPLPFPKWRC